MKKTLVLLFFILSMNCFAQNLSSDSPLIGEWVLNTIKSKDGGIAFGEDALLGLVYFNLKPGSAESQVAAKIEGGKFVSSIYFNANYNGTILSGSITKADNAQDKNLKISVNITYDKVNDQLIIRGYCPNIFEEATAYYDKKK